MHVPFFYIKIRSFLIELDVSVRFGAPGAPRLQTHSIQSIKLTGSSPIKLRLHHGAPELTQSKLITDSRRFLTHLRDVCLQNKRA